MKNDVAVIESDGRLTVLVFENTRKDVPAADAMRRHLAPDSAIRRQLKDGAEHANQLRLKQDKPVQPVPDFLGMSATDLLKHLQYDDYPEGLTLINELSVPSDSVIR